MNNTVKFLLAFSGWYITIIFSFVILDQLMDVNIQYNAKLFGVVLAGALLAMLINGLVQKILVKKDN